MTESERDALRVGGNAALRDAVGFDRLDQEISDLGCQVDHWKTLALAWEGVARNVAQVLEGRDGDGILKLTQQMKAHGIVKVED